MVFFVKCLKQVFIKNGLPQKKRDSPFHFDAVVLFFLNCAIWAAIYASAAFHAIIGNRIDIAFLNSAAGAFVQTGSASQTILGNNKRHTYTSLIIIEKTKTHFPPNSKRFGGKNQ
jgi:hypothetical protein